MTFQFQNKKIVWNNRRVKLNTTLSFLMLVNIKLHWVKRKKRTHQMFAWLFRTELLIIFCSLFRSLSLTCNTVSLDTNIWGVTILILVRAQNAKLLLFFFLLLSNQSTLNCLKMCWHRTKGNAPSTNKCLNLKRMENVTEWFGKNKKGYKKKRIVNMN